jgi:hypothetical protein
VPELLAYGDDGDARCVHCGALAVGPCARCEAPVCGDCCVLTTGGANVYAICLGCNERSGKDLRRGWLTVIGWFVTPILGLAAAVFLLSRC